MMSEATNVMLVGVGGQGTILASRVLAQLLLDAGFDVKMSEVHGMAQRGGSGTTHVRFGRRAHDDPQRLVRIGAGLGERARQCGGGQAGASAGEKQGSTGVVGHR